MIEKSGSSLDKKDYNKSTPIFTIWTEITLHFGVISHSCIISWYYWKWLCVWSPIFLVIETFKPKYNVFCHIQMANYITVSCITQLFPIYHSGKEAADRSLRGRIWPVGTWLEFIHQSWGEHNTTNDKAILDMYNTSTLSNERT